MTVKDGTYFPDYARMHKDGEDGGTVLKFIEFRRGYASYYKVCGDWYAYFRFRDGKFVCTNTPHDFYVTKHMRGMILTECTEKEFKEDNPYGIQEKIERELKWAEECRKEREKKIPIELERKDRNITYQSDDSSMDMRW